MHDSGAHVVIYTDIDTDGIMCGVLGYAALAELGFCVTLFLPDIGRGYGLDEWTVDRIVRENPDVQCILTADVGISEHRGIARAKTYGLDVMVTDHHKPGRETAADVVVDPLRSDESPSIYPYICGAHVLWLALHYYAEHYTDNPSYYVPQIDRLRVFAGIGTVADIMPVMYINRPLIRDAVAMARLAGNRDVIHMIPGCSTYRKAMTGLATLLEVFAERGKISARDMNEDMIGYYIAPVINSVKRMAESGASIKDAYDVFFGDAQRAAAERLLALNEERKRIVDEECAKLTQIEQPGEPYIYISDAPSGMLGLIAQRVMSRTGEPTLMLRRDPQTGRYNGSGRSPYWFKFVDEARAAEISGFRADGHDAAFGIGCEGSSVLDEVLKFMGQRVPAMKPSEDELDLRPDITISLLGDGDIGLDIPLIQEYLEELDYFRPFGNGFRLPTFALRFQASCGVWKTIGADNEHLAIRLPYGLRVLCWHQAKLVTFQDIFGDDGTPVGSEVKTADGDAVGTIEIWGRPEYNYFRGLPEVQFCGQICRGVPLD